MSILRLRRKKLNNAGMSLVEIIVAMAVLLIVTVPILYTFVYSANFNARARVRQQTTAAAQTVMENLKAYSMEEICRSFNAKDFPVSGMGGAGFDELVVSGVTFTPEGLPIYGGGEINLKISGMVYQRQTYDVDIKLSGHGSQASSIDALKYESYARENAASYAVGNAAMDSDALWAIMDIVAQKWTDMENAADPMASPAPTSAPAGHRAAEVDAGKITITERELKVDIQPDGSEYVAKVSCVYTFAVNDYPYVNAATGESGTFSIPGPGDPPNTDKYQVDLSEIVGGGSDPSKEIFRQSTPLEYLYLYYYPAYNYIPGVGSLDPGAPVKIGKDSIVINNTTGTETACYIYKQKNLAISDARLRSSEASYQVYISLNNACIYDDNLRTVLGGDTKMPTSNIHITPSDRWYKGIGYAAVETEYPGATSGYSPAIPTAMPTETVTENQQIMYDVEIILSDSGTGRQLGILTGTIVE
ncbi:MAG: type II secretion system GspH family protein [Acetatifactor sp.]|nr:type II secretion system GspH family protein [Acetatifactor sp.]